MKAAILGVENSLFGFVLVCVILLFFTFTGMYQSEKLSLILTRCLHSAKKLLIRQILCNERQRRQLCGRLSKVFLRSNDTAPTFPSRFFPVIQMADQICITYMKLIKGSQVVHETIRIIGGRDNYQILRQRWVTPKWIDNLRQRWVTPKWIDNFFSLGVDHL